MNCFGCTVCHFCLSYVNTEVKVTRVQKDFKKKKGVQFVSSCTSLMFGIKVLAASGSLLQLLGSIIFFCLLCLILTMHYEGSPGKEFAVVENGIIVEDDLSAILLECDCHITELGTDAWVCFVLMLLLKPTETFGKFISVEHKYLVLLVDLFI